MSTVTSYFSPPSHICVAAGGVAGSISTVVTNPIDVLKARMQASRDSAKYVGRKDFWESISRIRHSGFRRGYMCGLAPNLLASVPASAIYLSSYTQTKMILSSYSFGGDKKSVLVPAFSAFGAVGITTSILNPLFVIRLRAQISGEGVWKIFSSILKQEGISGFYRGLAAGVTGRSCESALYWMIYECSKSSCQTNKSSSLSVFGIQVLSLSMMSKLCSTCVAYPYNVVRTHLWEVNADSGKHDSNGVRHAMRNIWKADGMRGFYFGLMPQLARILPSTGLSLFAYELVLRSCGYKL